MNTKLQTPIIIVNFKAYLEATGKKAVELAKQAEKVSRETGICIGVTPQFAEISPVAQAAGNSSFRPAYRSNRAR